MRVDRLCAAALVLASLGCADDPIVNATSGESESSESTGDGESGDGDGDPGDGDGDPGDGDGDGDPGDGDGDGELVPDAGEARYVLVDESFELDASASIGAVLYHWNFGDGSAQPRPTSEPIASHSYAEPGRYYPVLTVYDAQGDSLATNVTITATHEPIHQPRHTGTLLADPLADLVALVSPDSDELLLVRRMGDADAPSFSVERHPTCDGPRVVGPGLGLGMGMGSTVDLVVACPNADQIQIFDVEQGPGPVIDLPRGTRPTAALAHDGAIFIALAGTAELAVLDPALPGVIIRAAALPDPRGLAIWPDGRLAISRWRSPNAEAQILLIEVDGANEPGAAEWLSLAYDPTPPSDTEIGGVPSYLDQILVSPIANEVAVPSIQANFLHGEYLTGQALTFETTIRAVVSFLELAPPDGMGHVQGLENFDRRKQFDNRGFAAAGTYSSRGDYLFVAMRGGRGVERYDVLGGAQAGTLLDVGYAPSGLALSPDDRHLYVDAALSRELRIYDVSSFDVLPQPIEIIPIVTQEPLAPEVLRGKQLFNDSHDPRIAKHGYIACAHCHLDGEADRRTWDFTDRGEGLRNTTSLLGRSGTGHGPVHWSANFDEIQDFEHDMRGPFGGTGLLDDADWISGTVNQTLGDPKAGLSDDLDALAAYVESLAAFPRSPHRANDGALTLEAQAGRLLFESPALGCTVCHTGATMTDSGFLAPADPLLHDVGTIGPGSGLRLGEPLTGLDTPTLHELWNSPPYLHDGSAQDLLEVLTAKNLGDLHGATSSLSAAELASLVAYLLSLEGQP
jgi:PKD repeat protein